MKKHTTIKTIWKHCYCRPDTDFKGFFCFDDFPHIQSFKTFVFLLFNKEVSNPEAFWAAHGTLGLGQLGLIHMEFVFSAIFGVPLRWSNLGML